MINRTLIQFKTNRQTSSFFDNYPILSFSVPIRSISKSIKQRKIKKKALVHFEKQPSEKIPSTYTLHLGSKKNPSDGFRLGKIDPPLPLPLSASHYAFSPILHRGERYGIVWLFHIEHWSRSILFIDAREWKKERKKERDRRSHTYQFH